MLGYYCHVLGVCLLDGVFLEGLGEITNVAIWLYSQDVKLIFFIGMVPKYSEKTGPSAALSTTNPKCCPDANPGRRGEKPATNRLSYGTALHKA
jgi:hypothetical protein